VIRPVIGGNKTKKCSIRMLLLDNPSICDWWKNYQEINTIFECFLTKKIMKVEKKDDFHGGG
jgi:hypothetical protein